MKDYCDKHDQPYEMMSGYLRCRACNREYQRDRYRKGRATPIDPVRQRAYQDKSLYGLTYEESVSIRSRGRCDACGTSEGAMCIDHDHETGEVRGLLCRHCNLVLGHAKDNPQLLRMLADYLERD